jgi:hypothetical protein
MNEKTPNGRKKTNTKSQSQASEESKMLIKSILGTKCKIKKTRKKRKT